MVGGSQFAIMRQDHLNLYLNSTFRDNTNLKNSEIFSGWGSRDSWKDYFVRKDHIG